MNPSNRKLRLMQITHDLAIGGLQQVIVNICRSINRDKFDISVLCLRDLGEFVPEVQNMRIKVIYLPQKEYGTDYLSFIKIARILKEESIDIIHTHNTQPFIEGTMAAILTRVKTVVHTDHGQNFPSKRRYMFFEWMMAHYAYKVVGVSEFTSKSLITYEHISPNKVTTIFNGVDETMYAVSVDKSIKRKQLGIRESGPVLGIAARLSEVKGITYLLQAMPAVVQQFPDVSLLIVGQGPLYNRLKNDCNILGIEKNVYFVGPRLDIPQLLKLFDLFVLPSISEGLPMILLEAMAAGCPILATDVGGVSTIIQHGFNGLLVTPKDPENLSFEIIRVLSDNAILKNFVSNGYVLLKRNFSAQTMTQQYERLYLRND